MFAFKRKNQKNHEAEFPPPRVAWTAVGILSLTYMFSFMDRQILVLLVEPIKADLQITDTQVSLLTGFSFAVVYAVMGIPMGRAADLWVRKYVIMFGVSIWSLLTIFCGFARSFPQLFFARMGVGLGEAALTPTAYSMVADLFPPRQLARAMSVFSLGGIAGGVAMSMLLGGVAIGLIAEMEPFALPLIGQLRPWQMVLIGVGGASLLMVLPLALMVEPKRQRLMQVGQVAGATEQVTFKRVLHFLWAHRAFYGPFIAGSCLANLFAYGGGAWIPSYFIRVHAWDAATTGITLGALYLVPAIIGGLISGWLADTLYGKGYGVAPLSLYAIAFACLGPVIVLFIYIPAMEVKMVFLFVLNFLLTAYAVLFPTIIQLATPNCMRGQISAIHLLAINLVGPGLGPTAVALVTDYGFRDSLAVGHAIAIVGVLAYGVGALVMIGAFGPFKRQLMLVREDQEEMVSPLLAADELKSA